MRLKHTLNIKIVDVQKTNPLCLTAKRVDLIHFETKCAVQITGTCGSSLLIWRSDCPGCSMTGTMGALEACTAFRPCVSFCSNVPIFPPATAYMSSDTYSGDFIIVLESAEFMAEFFVFLTFCHGVSMSHDSDNAFINTLRMQPQIVIIQGTVCRSVTVFFNKCFFFHSAEPDLVKDLPDSQASGFIVVWDVIELRNVLKNEFSRSPVLQVLDRRGLVL